MLTQKIKVGRNDPCPCESGLKYKKCCLTNGSSVTPALTRQAKNQQRLRQSVKKRCSDQCVFYEQETEIKMSEIILDLADDFLSNAESCHEVQNIIAATCIAWNIATAFPKEEHAEQIDKMVFDMKVDDLEQSLFEFIALMIERKLDWYPHVERFIIDYHVSGKLNNLNINIMSALSPEEIGL